MKRIFWLASLWFWMQIEINMPIWREFKHSIGQAVCKGDGIFFILLPKKLSWKVIGKPWRAKSETPWLRRNRASESWTWPTQSRWKDREFPRPQNSCNTSGFYTDYWRFSSFFKSYYLFQSNWNSILFWMYNKIGTKFQHFLSIPKMS